MAYIFTQEGYYDLLKAIEETRKKLEEIIKEKGESGRGSDGWHDEIYRATAVQEQIWSKRLGELQKLASSAKIIDPEEQNNIVQFGTGVLIEYEDGTIRRIILEGYQISHFKGLVSIHSPLGRVLVGAGVGEKRSFKVGDTERTVTVKDIILPSEARTFLSVAE